MRDRLASRELAWRLSSGSVCAVSLALALLALGREPCPARIPALTLDVNTAPAERLRLLEGVGPTLAERIVSDRETNGPYKTLEDLGRVPRIGPRTLRAVAPDLSLEPAPGAGGP